MVPWWTLILVTVAFFIREVIMRSKQSNFGEGYRKALIELSSEWNRLCKLSLPYSEFCERFRRYFQKKLKDGDRV